MLGPARAIQEQLVAWRRIIHMYPELSYQEIRTARLVAETLSAMGIEVQTGVGKTGVVGYLGSGPPAIGLRADMDALPIQEENEVSYASRIPGVMHACGHDAHTAILLGVAQILAQLPDRPHGQIRLLFQPSEEDADTDNKSGAVRMIEDGALEGVEAVIALHVASDLPANRIDITPGYTSANEDSFDVTLLGTGGHGALPHQGTDPTFILAQVINAMYGIRARGIDPTKGAVLSIGSIHGGTANNVIPSQITLTGTLRSFDNDTRERLKSKLAAAMEVARALGGDYRLTISPGYPSTYNDPHISGVIRQSVVEQLGEEALMESVPMMAAEDFAYMSRSVPGAMFVLGAKYDDLDRPHHTPVFDIDEDVLATGVAILADTACRLLCEKSR